MTPLDVAPPPPAASPALPSVPAPVRDAEVAAARGFVEASRAPATRQAYDADWRRFTLWCRARDVPALPALVALYLSALAARGLAPPSVARALAAIAHAHRQASLVAPHRAENGAVVAEVLAGIRRSRADAPDTKRAADADIVMQLLGAITGDSLAAVRDRALIAFGMALAARRSELVALDVADLAWEKQGLRVTIRRSKTDQDGTGAVVAVPEGTPAHAAAAPARLARGRRVEDPAGQPAQVPAGAVRLRPRRPAVRQPRRRAVPLAPRHRLGDGSRRGERRGRSLSRRCPLPACTAAVGPGGPLSLRIDR